MDSNTTASLTHIRPSCLIIDRNVLKWAAWLTMAIDHVGVMFAPAEPWPRIVGRLAFPLFVLLLADGVRRTRNLDVMVTRLTVWACLSQFVHVFAFGWVGLNVLFGLAGAAMAVRRPWWIALAVAILLEATRVEYGAASVLAVWFSGRSFRYNWVGWWVSGVYLAMRGGWSVLGWTGFAMPICAGIEAKGGMSRIPRWLSYGFYPGHLMAMIILRGSVENFYKWAG